MEPLMALLTRKQSVPVELAEEPVLVFILDFGITKNLTCLTPFAFPLL